MLRKVVLIKEEGLSGDVVRYLIKILLWDVSVIVYEHAQYVCMQIYMHV